jgi:hypothetical protein
MADPLAPLQQVRLAPRQVLPGRQALLRPARLAQRQGLPGTPAALRQVRRAPQRALRQVRLALRQVLPERLQVRLAYRRRVALETDAGTGD